MGRFNILSSQQKNKYKNIDSLFGDPIKWDLIETHWQDMMQVILSIKAGKITSTLLLRKFGNYSRKNKLYLTFQELGRALKTQFLLEYISDVELRETIAEKTNKVEAYNALSEWASFGSKHLVASNDEEKMEKAIKYNDILTDSIILQDIVDETNIIIIMMIIQEYVTIILRDLLSSKNIDIFLMKLKINRSNHSMLSLIGVLIVIPLLLSLRDHLLK